MAAIDFPNSPSEGDIHTVGQKRWKFTNGVWVILPLSSYTINVDGGVASSVYGGVPSLDGGGP